MQQVKIKPGWAVVVLAVEDIQLFAADNDVDSEAEQLPQQLEKLGAHFRVVILSVQVPAGLGNRLYKGSVRIVYWNCITAARNCRRLLVLSEPINSKGW